MNNNIRVPFILSISGNHNYLKLLCTALLSLLTAYLFVIGEVNFGFLIFALPIIFAAYLHPEFGIYLTGFHS